MKRIEKKIKDNVFLVKYGKDNKSLVRLLKTFDGLTFEESLRKILSNENEIDNEIDKQLNNKKQISSRIIIDIITASLGIFVFIASIPLVGKILTFTNVFTSGEIIFGQIFAPMLITLLYEQSASRFMKKIDKQAFKFSNNFKKLKLSKWKIEKVREKAREEYDKIIEQKQILGFQEKPVKSSEISSILKHTEKKEKSTEVSQPAPYTYNYQNESKNYTEQDYYTEEQPKKPKR